MRRETRPGRRRFVRLYYDDLEQEFPEVFFDPTAAWTYARLLMGADKAWPSLPELPKAVRRADMRLLTAVGPSGQALVTLCENGRYSVLGYAKDRMAREAHAKRAASGRWGEADHAVA